VRSYSNVLLLASNTDRKKVAVRYRPGQLAAILLHLRCLERRLKGPSRPAAVLVLQPPRIDAGWRLRARPLAGRPGVASPPRLEAVGAIDRAIAARLEGHHGPLTALRADGRGTAVAHCAGRRGSRSRVEPSWLHEG
jgi:hypothetical protein